MMVNKKLIIQLHNRISSNCVRTTHDPSKEAVDPVVVVAISYFINAKYTLLALQIAFARSFRMIMAFPRP